MGYCDLIQASDHEQVVFCTDKASGLKAIIGIHNTTLGPALGGCRMKPYASEEEALRDVLRLSKAMTYKSAMAGLDLGGGKTVVILDHPEQKTPELLQALAQHIDWLGGRYIGAGDIGSNTQDLALMKKTTRWITGLSKTDGGLGDSAILTSLGVFMGMKAAVQEQFNRDDMADLRVAVQGAGKVGLHLIGHLVGAGCQVWLSDINTQAMRQAKSNYPMIQLLEPDELFEVEVDVFSPNAVGGIIMPQVAETLKARIVAGGANNILSDESAGWVLKQREILYAPDFVINSGGVIMVACEIQQRSFEEARQQTEAVYNRTLEVFRVAREEDIPTQEAAWRLAQRRIDEAKKKQQQRADTQAEKALAALC